MMMITRHPNPTVQVPPWDDPTDHMHSLFSVSSNSVFFDELETPAYDDDDVPLDAFACDHFRMYEFKVRRCARGRSHDWTDCPYAHPGEKARRRDPRKVHYSGTPCPELRKGTCQRGDTCEFAHGVFECWLHPSRYRTQPCKDGVDCRRRICFFAHTPDQLRLLSPSVTSPSRFIGKPKVYFGSTSPPMSPGSSSVNELASYVRNLQIGNGPISFCSSPRSLTTLRPGLGYTGLPSAFDVWDDRKEEEPVMERVESGKELRARIYAKLTRDNSLSPAATP